MEGFKVKLVCMTEILVPIMKMGRKCIFHEYENPKSLTKSLKWNGV